MFIDQLLKWQGNDRLIEDFWKKLLNDPIRIRRLFSGHGKSLQATLKAFHSESQLVLKDLPFEIEQT